MKNKFIISIVVAIFVLIGSFFLMIENYFAPFPYIDTLFSSGETKNNWDKIQNGMNKQEVEKLLGAPLGKFCGTYVGYKKQLKSGENITEGDCYTYSEDGACRIFDFAWIALNVYYDEENKVLGKNEAIRYD